MDKCLYEWDQGSGHPCSWLVNFRGVRTGGSCSSPRHRVNMFISRNEGSTKVRPMMWREHGSPVPCRAGLLIHKSNMEHYLLGLYWVGTGGIMPSTSSEAY